MPQRTPRGLHDVMFITLIIENNQRNAKEHKNDVLWVSNIFRSDTEVLIIG